MLLILLRKRVVLIMVRRLCENDNIDNEKLEWIDTIPFDELFDEIRSLTNTSDLDFTTKVMNTGWDVYVRVTSQDLVDRVGFLKLMFKKLVIEGDLVVRKKDSEFQMWGHFSFSYVHPDSGSNGYAFLSCSYDDNKGWTFKETRSR